MNFTTLTTSSPIADIVAKAQELAPTMLSSSALDRSLIVVSGRGRLLADAHASDREMTSFLAAQAVQPSTGAEMRKTLGDIACAVAVRGVPASFLIVQASTVRSRSNVDVVA